MHRPAGPYMYGPERKASPTRETQKAAAITCASAVTACATPGAARSLSEASLVSRLSFSGVGRLEFAGEIYLSREHGWT